MQALSIFMEEKNIGDPHEYCAVFKALLVGAG
jgi:hypothetical protein